MSLPIYCTPLWYSSSNSHASLLTIRNQFQLKPGLYVCGVVCVCVYIHIKTYNHTYTKLYINGSQASETCLRTTCLQSWPLTSIWGSGQRKIPISVKNSTHKYIYSLCRTLFLLGCLEMFYVRKSSSLTMDIETLSL